MINPKLHYKRYCELMNLTTRPQCKTDSGYMAAFYILAADNDLYKAAVPHINENGINFYPILTALNRKYCRSSQIFAAKSAHNLFNGGSSAISIEQLAQCDLPTLDILVNAIYIHKGHRTPIAGPNGLMGLDNSHENATRKLYAQLFSEAEESV